MATTNEDPIKHINVRQMGRTDAEDDIQANISLPSPSHPMSNTSQHANKLTLASYLHYYSCQTQAGHVGGGGTMASDVSTLADVTPLDVSEETSDV